MLIRRPPTTYHSLCPISQLEKSFCNKGNGNCIETGHQQASQAETDGKSKLLLESRGQEVKQEVKRTKGFPGTKYFCGINRKHWGRITCCWHFASSQAWNVRSSVHRRSKVFPFAHWALACCYFCSMLVLRGLKIYLA